LNGATQTQAMELKPVRKMLVYALPHSHHDLSRSTQRRTQSSCSIARSANSQPILMQQLSKCTIRRRGTVARLPIFRVSLRQQAITSPTVPARHFLRRGFLRVSWPY
jgi:hypothetical protein